MGILIICYSYAPSTSPRALRWTALSEDWARRGLKVHVVTSKPTGQSAQETRNGVVVHRVGGNVFSDFRQWATVPSVMLQEHESHNHYMHLRHPGARDFFVTVLRKILRVIHDRSWKQLYWPDACCLWILPAARCGQRLRSQHQFDVLVSVSHPFSGHVAGFLVQRNQPKLTWLADSGDPFAFSKESAPNNFRIWEKLNFWIERKLINAANIFSVTTNETAQLYRKYFPEDANKLKVIPPLLQTSFQDAKRKCKEASIGNDIVLLFVGKFYKDVRPPEPLLALFEQVISKSGELSKHLKLHIIGPVGFVFVALQQKPNLRARVDFLGEMPHSKAVEAMLSANCLVNVGNSTHYQLPSKVIEYMATGKPILNISSIGNDSSNQVLKNYPACYNWGLNQANDLNALCRFLENCRGQTLSPGITERVVDEFGLSSISDQYLAALSGTTA